MPTNAAKAQLGRFQSRLSRIVDLVSSRTIETPIPGRPGQTSKQIIWSGLLYKSDGKNIDSIHEWEPSGAFKNNRGVSHPNDLALFMRVLGDDELADGRARLPAYARPPETPAAEPATSIQITDVQTDPVQSEAVKDPRIQERLTELTWNAYQELIADAVMVGVLPHNTVVTKIRGPWAELIASTLVDYLDHPEVAAEEPAKPAPEGEPGKVDGEKPPQGE